MKRCDQNFWFVEEIMAPVGTGLVAVVTIITAPIVIPVALIVLGPFWALGKLVDYLNAKMDVERERDESV